MYRLLAGLIAGVWFLCRALLILWATLAIYYSNLPWSDVRLVLALAFAAFAVWAVWFAPGRRMTVDRIISWNYRVVDIHLSLARSSMAT